MTTEKATIFSPVNNIEYSKNSVESQQRTKNDVGNITLSAFDKDQQLSQYSAPFDVTVLVLDWEVEIKIKIGGTPHVLKAGNMIIMPANIPHAVFAISPFKMLLTMIKAKYFTIRKSLKINNLQGLLC